jgi:hypothetical protein
LGVLWALFPPLRLRLRLIEELRPRLVEALLFRPRPRLRLRLRLLELRDELGERFLGIASSALGGGISGGREADPAGAASL